MLIHPRRFTAALLAVTLLLLIPALPARGTVADRAPTSKVMVIVIENHSWRQVKAGMPKVYDFAKQYGYATNMKAIVHPSKPNYFAVVSGGLQGETSNRWAVEKSPNIMFSTRQVGRTAKTYADGMGSDRCRIKNGPGKYVKHHNPEVHFISTKERRASCEKYNFDAKYLVGDIEKRKIPNVGLLIPDNCHNAHDCSLKTADKWIAARVKELQLGPDWQAGNLTIVITADEDDKKSGNVIPGIVLHPSLNHVVVDEPLNLYSLGGFMADLGHTARLGEQKTAPDFAQAFGLVAV